MNLSKSIFMKEKNNSFFFIGIGGIGMSALAHILLEKKQSVAGSDKVSTKLIQKLVERGAAVVFSDSSKYLDNASTIIYGSAITNDHPQMKKNIPSLHRVDLLCDLMKNNHPLLVTGTHGKTSTSSLLAWTLSYLEQKPSFAIGGVVKGLEKNGGYGTGDYFVAEADESDGSFEKYKNYSAIITNVEKEHLSYWKDLGALKKGFSNFMKKIPRHRLCFYCSDDPILSAMNLRGISYGFEKGATVQGKNFKQKSDESIFDIEYKNITYRNIVIAMPGKHQALNAIAVFGLCIELGLECAAIMEAFAHFKGIYRRADFKGQFKGALVFDDYAHHPTEISVTLQAFKERYPSKQIIAIFEPHKFTRTKDFFEEFIQCFKSADMVFVTDIYSAGESEIEGITSADLVQGMMERNLCQARYVRKEDLKKSLEDKVDSDVIVLTIGAGTITNFADELVSL